MNKYPTKIKINSKIYPINSDFRIALKCDDISRDETIGDYEKVLAIIYLLLGEEALNDFENHDKIYNLCVKFLQKNQNVEELDDDDDTEEPSMDFSQDEGRIKASFITDCKINLDEIEYLHWWLYYDLLCGLTEDCILNRVRYIREESLEGKKGKELEQWKKMKKQVALKHDKSQEEKEMDYLFECQMKGE